MSILVNPLYTLNASIRACLFLLPSNVHKFKCLSLSSHDRLIFTLIILSTLWQISSTPFPPIHSSFILVNLHHRTFLFIRGNQFVTCTTSKMSNQRRRRRVTCEWLSLKVCMGMGKTGIPWVPWDSHGNGNTISHGNGNGMGMGIRRMGMGIKTWEWEKITAY